MLRAHAQDHGGVLRFGLFGRAESRVMIEQCCNGDLSYLLLQINVICLLLALIGTTAILKYPTWFGECVGHCTIVSAKVSNGRTVQRPIPLQPGIPPARSWPKRS